MPNFSRLYKLLCILIAGLTVQILLISNAYAADMSPVGRWKTIDDKTHEPRSIIQIWEQNGELQGKIIKVFYRAGEKDTDVCTLCKGNLHNQRILGMTFMWGLKQKGDQWRGGYIVDPKNGQTYNCLLQLSKDGQELNVRGYIGFSLFGRSQTWLRQQD